MSSRPDGLLRQAWSRWKSLKLPWRKKYLVGLDLQGNTFWEFRDSLSAQKNRMRRIVQCPPTTHLSEVRISPQWHQWLRHTRLDPPSLTEQSQDLIRQENLKVLAAQADARWAAKASMLDQPAQSREQPIIQAQLPDGTPRTSRQAYNVEDNVSLVTNMSAGTPEQPSNAAPQQSVDTLGKLNGNPAEAKKDDPWKTARGGPNEEWQPASWGGQTAARRD